jgi:hypothetical protein
MIPERRVWKRLLRVFKSWRLRVIGILSLMGFGVGELAKHAFYGSILEFLNARKGWIMEEIKPMLFWLLDHPITWPVILCSFLALLSYSTTHDWRWWVAPVGHTSLPLSTSIQNAAIKPPKHNVQCLGVIVGEKAAKIGFRNVEVANQKIADFHQARARIRYTVAASGAEIATVHAAQWADSREYDISIGFDPQYAVVAVFLENCWFAVSTVEVLTPWSESEAYFKREYTPLPTGHLKIEATLFGEENLTLPAYYGVLTLTEDGQASFAQI